MLTDSDAEDGHDNKDDNCISDGDDNEDDIGIVMVTIMLSVTQRIRLVICQHQPYTILLFTNWYKNKLTELHIAKAGHQECTTSMYTNNIIKQTVIMAGITAQWFKNALNIDRNKRNPFVCRTYAYELI